MQRYAKKMGFVVCLFLISILWYQADNAEFSPNHHQPKEWFNIACVPYHTARSGLDTHMRTHGLSQFTKNIHTKNTTNHSSAQRCYFRVNADHIGCFNPQLITKEYLEKNGFDLIHAFPGGSPGQLCYFKKEFMNNYLNLITILKRNGMINDLNQKLVKSSAEAIKKLAQPLASEE